MNTYSVKTHVLKRCTKLPFLVFLVALSLSTNAQITVTGGYTAAQMAAKLTGAGVTVFGATLTCPADAYGEFVVVSSSLGLDSGIVLTNGTAVTTTTTVGVDITNGLTAGDLSNFASTDNTSSSTGGVGDPDLTALAGLPTFDACILEFNFKPAGDTIRFRYVFGSEEYTDFTCTTFNDVFGFLISGGAYTTPTNVALVPGTTIPVCINSVNCGATGGGSLSTCTALGTGSPFCAYYVNNFAGTTVSYDGLTTVLTAQALVSPCDTYHLKLGVADASDHVLDSGVFIEAGSLTSRPPVTISGVGLSGLPYCVRGCSGATFQFTTPVAQDTPIVVHYNIVGTAINGYDYSMIPDSIIIPPFTLSTILNITPTVVTPTGSKTVTLEIMVQDPCHPGVFTIGALSTITILDSFTMKIITPDTAICNGEFAHIIAIGDTIFTNSIHYLWSPSGTVSNDTILSPIVTPTVTTTYTLTGSTLAALGCAPEHSTITVSVFNALAITTDSALVKTCVGVPVDLHAYATPDTTPLQFIWSPPAYLSNDSVYNPTVDPLAPGNYTYTITVYPIAVPTCISTQSLTVHVLPNDFVLNNNDTAICLGQSVMGSITGPAEFSYFWTPVTGVSNPFITNPVLTPGVTTTYVANATYAHCPEMSHAFTIEVDTLAPAFNFIDTICLGMSDSFNIAVAGPDTGSNYYHYQWTPPGTDISNDTIPNPVITPATVGIHNYTIFVHPHALGCQTTDVVTIDVLPNAISVRPTDTAICLGQVVQVVGIGDPSFSYQWIPTAGIAGSTVLNALITPDTSALYTVTASFHRCPDMHATLNLDVQPNPSVYIGGNRFLCQYDSLHIHAITTPEWYGSYIYSWTPVANLDNSTSSTVVFTGGTTTELYVNVTTPAGCSTKDSALITLTPGNFASILHDTDFCPHDSLVLSPTAIVGGVTYHWYPSFYLSDSLGGNPVIKPIATQTYTIIASTPNGCLDTLSFTATVHPAAVILMADSATITPGESYHISPSTNCTSLQWFPSTGLDNVNITDPTANPEVSTQYFVKGVTDWGCIANDSISIFVDESSSIAVPNAFTPGTGTNSEFKIIMKGIATLNYFRIFNRWGNLLYETNQLENGWDGTFKGQPQPFGVYIYEIQAVNTSGKIFTKQGNLTLIR